MKRKDPPTDISQEHSERKGTAPSQAPPAPTPDEKKLTLPEYTPPPPRPPDPYAVRHVSRVLGPVLFEHLPQQPPVALIQDMIAPSRIEMGFLHSMFNQQLTTASHVIAPPTFASHYALIGGPELLRNAINQQNHVFDYGPLRNGEEKVGSYIHRHIASAIRESRSRNRELQPGYGLTSRGERAVESLENARTAQQQQLLSRLTQINYPLRNDPETFRNVPFDELSADRIKAQKLAAELKARDKAAEFYVSTPDFTMPKPRRDTPDDDDDAPMAPEGAGGMAVEVV